MIHYLLDTNVISEPARPEPDEGVLRRLNRYAGETALASVVWHELYYGIARLDQGRKRAYLKQYLRDVVQPSQPILGYDQEAAQWHAEMRADLEGQGRVVSFADGQIAAIAATRGLILVTRNVPDFAPFDELKVENWFDDED